MATAVIAFRWLDVLEHEFDKAFVELDCLLPEMDVEEPEMVDAGRKKLSSLSSAFAQLIHKAQTIFQNNAKLEVSVSFPTKFLLTPQTLLIQWLVWYVFSCFLYQTMGHEAINYYYQRVA